VSQGGADQQGAKFVGGQRQNSSCPSCGAGLPPSARFCPSCGAPAPREEATDDPLRARLEAAIGFQYRIERPLGRGGMGAVYLAHELALDRPVAIKVLPPEGDATERRERFRREARLAARLNHPNIVPLYTFGEVGGLAYFVMGYVPGESLGTLVKRRGRLEPEEARSILRQVADALDYAHRQGVIHRDIKPDNVLLDAETGRPMLADFGIAKGPQAGTLLTVTGQLVGTPAYMSPEQASGRPDIDGRSDLYSLGVTGYVMLSGRLPFEGQTPADMIRQHIDEEPVALRVLAPEVPPTLASAITRCLAKDPGRRWANAASLRAALDPAEAPEEETQEVRVLRASVFTLVAAAVGEAYAWLPRAFDPGWRPPELLHGPLLALLGIAAVGFVGMSATLRWSERQSWSSIVHTALGTPSWWPFWYPAALRRPGDVWARLPARIRWFRAFVLAACLWLALVIVPALLSVHGDDYYGRTGKQTVVGQLVLASAGKVSPKGLVIGPLLALLLGLMVVGGVVGRQLEARLGPHLADPEQATRPLLEPTGNAAFWRREPFASVLRAEPVAGAHETPRTPEAYLAAIARAAATLPAAQRPLGEAVLAAARALDASLRRVAEQSTLLAPDVDPQERARLEARLAALGPFSPEEPPERREMRGLLDRQLKLLGELAARVEDAKSSRASQLDRMQQLWVALVQLSASSAPGHGDDGAEERLRTLCRRVAADVRAGESEAPTATFDRPGGGPRGSG
jgi:hypothetical protein